MYDLQINDKGDLMLESASVKKEQQLKIYFMIWPTKAVKVSFNLEYCSNAIKVQDNSMVISFDINRNKNLQKEISLTGDDAASQLIKFRIKTTLGDIESRPDIGSKLELYRHDALFDEDLLTNIETTVKDSISDILPDAVVKANAVIDNSGRYFKSVISIQVSGEGFSACEFSI